MSKSRRHSVTRENNSWGADASRWLQLWIAGGLVLAVLLLVSSISTYVLVSRRLIVDHLRSELLSQVAMMDQQAQRSSVRNRGQLAAILQQAQERNKGRIAWIQIQDGRDATVAQAGSVPQQIFSNQYVRSHLMNRQPIFRTIHTGAGPLLVETFPFRVSDNIAPVEPPERFSFVGPTPRRFGTIQLAASLEGAGSALWPLKRSLIINSSAALVLLLSLTVISVRLRSYLSGQQLEHEVDIARSVQQDLLPASKLELEGFKFAADYVPCARVSGDFYDTFCVKDQRAAFVLGDVSGKGVPAALLMGVIHGAVRSCSWTDSPGEHEAATRQLNQLLCERAASERFATMFWSYFDSNSQHLKYINAGHCRPVLVRPSRRSTILRLASGGPVLGLLPNAEFQQGSVRLEPGDVLVLYSDGIVEATSSADEEFGEDRVVAIVTEHCKDSAEEIRNRILASVDAFTGRNVPQDDQTLCVIVYLGAAQRTGNPELQAIRGTTVCAA